MLTTETAVSTIPNLGAIAELEELDDQVRDAIAGNDEAEPVDETPTKLSKAERKVQAQAAENAQKDAERAALQALVPWKVVEDTTYYNNQQREIDQWADDEGTYPRAYRAYSREEWTAAINALAAAVAALPADHPEYQRRTGLYVEEHGPDLLLIVCKEWQLVIQVPSKATAGGKKFELKAAPGKDAWGGEEKRVNGLVELLAEYVAGDGREALLDVCCQYLRAVRIRVNKRAWAAEHPELAHHVANGS